MGLSQRLLDVAIFRNVPRTDVCRDTVGLQTVASHQHATVVLHHTLAVASIVVQGQHHADAYGALTHVFSLCGRLRGHLWCLECCAGHTFRLLSAGIGYLDIVTLLQLVARGVHLWVGLDELVDGQTVLAGYAKDGLLALHLVQLLVVLHLCQCCFCHEAYQCQQE